MIIQVQKNSCNILYYLHATEQIGDRRFTKTHHMNTIRIRPVRESDSNAFHLLAIKNKDRLADFFPITLEKAETPEKSLASIRMYNTLAAQNELHVLAIEQGEDEPAIIGLVFLKNIDKKTSKCEIAYFIDKEYEGRGLTSQAVKQAVNMAFDELQLNKVYCRVGTDNAASNKVAVKSGFELEGVLKQEYRIDNGTLIDLNYYGLLRNS